jgi:antirestriction protein ArdC
MEDLTMTYNNNSKQKRDVHREITDKIIAKLTAGNVGEWKKSWSSLINDLPLRATGEPYQGINTLILALEGRGNPYWFTYKKAKELGGQVRKGEKSTVVVFFKPIKVTDKKTEEETVIPYAKGFNVFNAEQIDGLPEKFFPTDDPQHNEPRLDDADAYIKRTGAEIRHGGGRAFYSPAQDFIQLPQFDQFDNAQAYYGAALHELTHWTKAKKRLDRNYKTSSGTKDYAREELVAELGACFLTATLNIETEVREDHIQYLANWLQLLRDDKRAIFRAAAAAQKAVNFLNGLQTEQAVAA